MMKKLLSLASIALIGAIISCQSDEGLVSRTEIPQVTLNKISKLGFSNENVIAVNGGYIVEGDIMLHHHDLDAVANRTMLDIAEGEQYHTNNLVDGPRNISVSISSKLPSSMVAALDEAINRYNAQNLSLTFSRVSSGADISFVSGNGPYLASAGFPTTSGEPYGQVKVNARQLNGQPLNTVASVFAHEMGHCIGFRHTDWMSRQYSCGGAASNEGEGSIGAILIPGTPSGPDSGSWMLACIGSGQNRPFNNNDKTALSYLY
jgi:hypothetical protein